MNWNWNSIFSLFESPHRRWGDGKINLPMRLTFCFLILIFYWFNMCHPVGHFDFNRNYEWIPLILTVFVFGSFLSHMRGREWETESGRSRGRILILKSAYPLTHVSMKNHFFYYLIVASWCTSFTMANEENMPPFQMADIDLMCPEWKMNLNFRYNESDVERLAWCGCAMCTVTAHMCVYVVDGCAERKWNDEWTLDNNNKIALWIHIFHSFDNIRFVESDDENDRQWNEKRNPIELSVSHTHTREECWIGHCQRRKAIDFLFMSSVNCIRSSVCTHTHVSMQPKTLRQ